MFKAVHFPDGRKSNPYQICLGRALECNGINVYFIKGLNALFNTALKERFDLFHLHWIHDILLGESTGKTIVKSISFLLILLLIKIRGKRIIWTVHNLKNHENRQVQLELLFSKIVARMADLILVHGETVIPLIRGHLQVSSEKIHVLPHGNYDGHVLPAKDKPMLREEMGLLEETKVFLYFGVIREYKGVPELIESFRQLKGDVRLIIAGFPRSDKLKREIEKIASQDSRVELRLSYIPDNELAELLKAADAVVLPYKDIFTSGSLLLALTFGKAVVAPNIGLIPEYVDHSCAFLYELDETDGLYNSLKAAVESDCLNDMGRTAREKADNYNWDSIGRQLAALCKES